MTLREMATDVLGSEPRVVLMGVMQIFRSLEQLEAATFEGCCASALEWTNQYGEPTSSSIKQWLDDIGELADRDIPDELITAWIVD